MDPVQIVLAIDRNCVLGCAVALRSILDNASPGSQVSFHIATNGVSAAELHTLCQTVREAGRDATVRLAEFDPAPVRHLMRSRLISHTAYATLFLDTLLPDEVGRCIFVDSDLVFERDVAELWSTDLQGRTLGAIDNGMAEETLMHQKRLGLRAPDYFNSGVLLADLERWRDLGVGARALEAAGRVGADLILHDQDALNMALQGDWVPLPWYWNAWVIRGDLTEESRAVFHYMGGPKPWQAHYDGPFRDRWFRYLDRTPFAGWRPWNPAGLGRQWGRFRRLVPFVPGLARLIRSQFQTHLLLARK